LECGSATAAFHWTELATTLKIEPRSLEDREEDIFCGFVVIVELTIGRATSSPSSTLSNCRTAKLGNIFFFAVFLVSPVQNTKPNQSDPLFISIL